MQDNKSFRKYQVYFFLYLAVICELLIIIVERDDAETQLRRERDELYRLTQKIITELVETAPVQSLNGSTTMEVGDRRLFFVSVQGMGPDDELTRPPEVLVFRGTDTLQRLKPEVDVRPVEHQLNNGERRYAFEWTAPGPGQYRFIGNSANNRFDEGPGGRVKLASMEFPRRIIEAFVPNYREIFQRHEVLHSELSVDVIAAGSQLLLNGGELVTAAGYPASGFIEVQGVAASSVRVEPSHGSVTQEDERIRWEGTFPKPGDYRVRLNGRDTRGAGSLSRDETAFRVTVKWPVSASTVRDAFAGELFRKNLAVAGLEDRSRYRWEAALDGARIAAGDGSLAEFPLPDDAAGKTLRMQGFYGDRIYPVAVDEERLGDSRFTYAVLDAPVRFRNLSFSRGGEYPVNQEFRFDAYVCGSCIAQNQRAPERIWVDAESESGRDLLDDYVFVPISDASGRTVGMRLKFYLGGRVSRDGEEVLLTLHADDAVRRIPVIIYPD